MTLMNNVKVEKRDGTLKEFDASKITSAILLAMDKIGIVNNEVAEDITKNVILELEKQLEEEAALQIHIEKIQDMVIKVLIDSHVTDIAIEYITHRERRRIERELSHKHKTESIIQKAKYYKYLSSEFLSKYKKLVPPFTELGHFTYFRTYSRWIDGLNRREYWYETVARAVEYIMSITPTISTKEEAEAIYDNMFNLRQFCAGRTYWMGGTAITNKFPISNFNCSFLVIDSIDNIREFFYLLMLGKEMCPSY